MEMQIGSIVPMNVIWKFDSVKKTDFLSDNIDVKKLYGILVLIKIEIN